MIRFLHKPTVALLAAMLCACGPAAQPPPAKSVKEIPPRDALLRIVDRYWDDFERVNPRYPGLSGAPAFGNALGNAITVQALADSMALERRYLLEILALPRDALDADAGLTYDIFRRERMLAVESYKYPAELLPVNPYDGMPQRFALAAAGISQPLVTRKDFDDWQLRAERFVEWSAAAIANLRDGLRRGYTLPRTVVEQTLPVMAALGNDSPDNVLYLPGRSLPATLSDADRGRIRDSLDATVRSRLLPAYRALHDFLQNEYLPRARDSVGLSALMLGDAWYAFLVKRATSGTDSAGQLHAQGLAEMDRLHARVKALLADAAFPGDPAAYAEALRHDPRYGYRTADELLAAVQDTKSAVTTALALGFTSSPRADFDVRKVEAFRARVTPPFSYVHGAGNLRGGGILYVNTLGLDARPATALTAAYLREAEPGHHWQLSLQQERTDLPRFRRRGGDAAFVAGWGLYAAGLGEELGVYKDAQARFGALVLQLTCAAQVVVDTGLHAQGWTRQQALDYVHAQLPLDDGAAAALVDRAIALPGDGLSCTVGERKFQALRTRTQAALGARFDLKAFDDALLVDGAMPLDMLDARIKRWMEALPRLD